MKRLTAIALFAIANLAVVGKSFAQPHAVQATVPFDFKMSNALLPAGTYMITKASNLIIVRNEHKPVVALALFTPGDGNSRLREKLIFTKYGDQYFLSGLESHSAGISMRILSSKQERQAKQQLEATKGGSTQILVATRR